MGEQVLKYVAASKRGSGPLIAMAQDLPNMVIVKEAAFPVEYGVKGQELLNKFRAAAEEFIRAMELRGYELIPLPQGNPQAVTNPDGTPYGTYSVTKDLEKAGDGSAPGAPSEGLDELTEGKGAPTFRQPMSLEDSQGWIDYRIIGVFWAPQVAMEIAVEREQLLAQERAARNPRTWGGGKTTPNTPSLA